VKCMIQKPLLSGQMGRWAYSLVEYELAYKPLKVVKGWWTSSLIMGYNSTM
jgi:hypothetical protein